MAVKGTARVYTNVANPQLERAFHEARPQRHPLVQVDSMQSMTSVGLGRAVSLGDLWLSPSHPTNPSLVRIEPRS